MRRTPVLIDPVDREYRRRRARCCAFCGIAAYLVAIVIYWGVFAEVPVEYSDDAEHFKYGSIGSDSVNGIPYWVWLVLPEMFPDHLPDADAFLALPDAQRTGLQGYAQFGFIVEEGHDRPIGFSKRRVQVDRVGLNCAVCHVSVVRVTEGLDPTKIYGGEPTYVSQRRERVIVPGMPANTVDLQAYFEFLFRCASDSRFTSENVLAYVARRVTLNPKERFYYKAAIFELRETLLTRQSQLGYFHLVPRFGPGRVDTFTPYKTIHFSFPYDGTVGTADFPSLWNQRPREGMQLHWDGNNKSVFERNISASLGAGVTPVSLDMPRMLRVARWIGSPEPDSPPPQADDEVRRVRADHLPHAGELPIPKFPYAIDHPLANGLGKALYRRHCASCHDWEGQYVGQVVPIQEIGTDRYRLDSYTVALSVNQATLGTGQWWRFRNFRKTAGYANMPLDGLWARAPYLHNGSVPTLRDLLQPPEQRPSRFYRGDDVYDPARVGFRYDRDRSADSRQLFLFDTTLRGNGNGGHTYGVDLPDAEKTALLEYLKTL